MTIHTATLFSLPAPDFELIQTFDHEFFPEPWTNHNWLAASKDPSYFVFYERLGLELISFALFRYSELEELAHLLKICSHPNYLRKGKAKAIMCQAKTFFAAKQTKRLYLEVAAKNTPALDFYLSLEFQELNRIPQFYSNGSDAVTMELKLSPL